MTVSGQVTLYQNPRAVALVGAAKVWALEEDPFVREVDPTSAE